MKVTLLAVGLPVCVVLLFSMIGFARERTPARFLELAGAAGLLVVVLAHVAEAFQILLGMGWGRNDSAGHYVDLFSAILGLTLLPLGYLLRVLPRNVPSGISRP